MYTRMLYERFGECGGHLVVVGDKSGPSAYELPGVTFLSLEAQCRSGFRLASLLPIGHYARKNIGYLQAIANQAPCLYETDDDNAPLPDWHPRESTYRNGRTVPRTHSRWLNAYGYFTSQYIWPRGFPLDEVRHQPSITELVKGDVSAPVQQALVNRAPDVDAVWRLLFGHELDFDRGVPALYLTAGNWCPFNSQNTWWWPEAYPLMYLPSFCSFRMCDIWRSFIALRCLWAMNAGILFLPADSFQERNAHRLMKDFDDEIPGYLGNKGFVRVLEETELESGSSGATVGNLRRCYQALIGASFFPPDELPLVDAWVEDLRAIGNTEGDCSMNTG